ncbi:MAG: PAS domain S-box protein [Verrucomicrobiia bacterium]
MGETIGTFEDVCRKSPADVNVANPGDRHSVPKEGSALPLSVSATSPARGALKIVLSYILFATLWILFSDQLLAAVIKDPAALMKWSMFKGLVFVAVTGSLLYALIHRLVTRLHETRSSLLASEQQLRVIFDHTSLFIGLLKPDGTLIKTNQSALAFAAATPGDVNGKPFWETPWWKHSPEVQAKLRQAIENAGSGQPARFEAVLRDACGTLRDFDVSITPIKDESGQVVFLVPEGYEVTAHKQAEAELNRLMTAIEQTPESIVITDTQGGILYVNPAYEQVTGYRRAEVMGLNTRLLKSGKQGEAFYRELWARVSAGEVWRGRFINKKKNGTLFTEEAVIAPVRDGTGTVTNYIAVKRDISRELELEDQYRQTQKIDSIGRLAGGVAHDFNNILAVICGHTDLALMQLSPDAPLRSNLECIQESAERAANLTRQLLAFARRQVIEPRLINLNELIVNLNKMLHRLIGEDVRLVTQTAPDLGQIKADPGQIEQVLLNLVVNARDAMPEGGTLTIHTDNVTLDEAYARRHLVTPGDYVMVSVSDTGVGMTDEVKQHIFEPFFTTKEQGKGTGLGLATCFGIIQQSNGHIDSDSQVGTGTQFKIYLPRFQGVEDATAHPEIPARLPQGTETILLAEDEPSLRRLMARVLRTQGYTVLEAADGNEALALAQANGTKIQLLLTDVIMPGLSGKMLGEWLSQVNPAVKVLFVSGYINNNAVRDAMSKPGTFFLQKPFNPLELTKKVRAAIEST